MWETLYEFALKFAKGIGELWEWLITDFTFIGIDTGIPPIFAIVGAAAIIGLTRRIL